MAQTIDVSMGLAVALCKKWEGFSAKPYLCPAGVPTTGFGTTYYENGVRVTLQDPPVDRVRAEALLSLQLRSIYLAGVLKCSPSLIAYPLALGALTSFAYNLGVPRYRSSTLRKRVDAADWEGARAEIVKWRRAGGMILKGLENRRRDEAQYLHG